MENEVLAVIAGEEITQKEFDAFLQSVPQDRQAYISNPQFRQQCLEQLIALRLFAQFGKEQELDQTEGYKKIVENAKRDILAQMAMTEMLEKVTVSDEEAKEYYEANKQQFSRGETVNAKHILTDAEDKCTSILDSIVSGEKTFEEAAKEFSTCPSNEKGGDLGEFTRGQMVKEFDEAAFEAEVGHVVGPVKTQFGYHLIKVEEKKPAAEMSFDEVKENIKVNLTQQKQNKICSEKVEELKKKYMK